MQLWMIFCMGLWAHVGSGCRASPQFWHTGKGKVWVGSTSDIPIFGLKIVKIAYSRCICFMQNNFPRCNVKMVIHQRDRAAMMFLVLVLGVSVATAARTEVCGRRRHVLHSTWLPQCSQAWHETLLCPNSRAELLLLLQLLLLITQTLRTNPVVTTGTPGTLHSHLEPTRQPPH